MAWQRFSDGDLPPVCVKTGMPADGTVRVTFSRLPTWTYLLLLAGIVPFLIAAFFAREQVRGRVPVTRAAVERYEAYARWLRLGWGLAGFGLLAAAVLSEPWMLMLLAVGFGVVLVVELRRAQAWIAGNPVPGTAEVEIRRVHPNFAASLQQTTPSSS